jgi:transcription antitermination protein NusB
MPGRRRAREYALQALYAVDLSGKSASAALNAVWASGIESKDAPPTEEEIEFAGRLVHGVEASMESLDAAIEKASVNWRLGRMPVVDRNILRIGAWELGNRKDIPVSVSINEAIELAKRFGGAESRAFVNGILDRIAAEVGRGGRKGRG